MRLFFLLLFGTVAATAAAQASDAELKKITEKNMRLLREAELQRQLLQNGNGLVVPIGWQ